MVKVRVPATSANIGPGFDSMGLALGLYNYVTAEETDGGLVIDILDETSAFLAKDERNLVYRSMKAVFDKVGYQPKGLHLTMENNIMVTRGLGSSSAGIVSGLVAANEICGKPLSTETILRNGCLPEFYRRHPFCFNLNSLVVIIIYIFINGI